MAFLLRVLGPVTIAADGDPPASSRVTQPRQLAVLVYLALAKPAGLQPRDQLMELLWPDHTPEQARRGLRNALHGVRQALGADALLSVGSTLVGLDPAVVACDATELEAGRLAWTAPIAEPLDGLYVSGAAAFDHWLSAQRERLRELSRRRAASPAIRSTPRAPVLATPRLTRRPHSDDAYALYLRGHYCFLRAAHDGDATTLEHCRAYFERALALDPEFADAMAGLSNYYAVAARRGILTPFDRYFGVCLDYSARALALDDRLAIPHVHFGVEAMYLTDQWARAGEQFALSVAKDPSYAEGWRFFAVWLGLDGRPAEALSAAEEAARLEPDIVTMLGTLGAARLAAGDATGAESAWRRVLEMDPRHAPSRERLIRLLEEQERFDEAVAERGRGGGAWDAEGFRVAWEQRAAAGYLARRHEELRRTAEHLESQLIEQRAPSPLHRFAPPVLRLIAALAQLGEWSRVRTWQLQALAERPALSRWLAAMPELRGAPTVSGNGGSGGRSR
jgi:DNA-binding SARP family transcriptional activator